MGAGEDTPVASNESAAGRQQNRRVEVIISNPALAAL
jgi:outer membrane protein OmpA-like peptidoglycan-associated protein